MTALGRNAPEIRFILGKPKKVRKRARGAFQHSQELVQGFSPVTGKFPQPALRGTPRGSPMRGVRFVLMSSFLAAAACGGMEQQADDQSQSMDVQADGKGGDLRS